jgi:NTP pyrophosphatase (non-canonical NTP hydrolase)
MSKPITFVQYHKKAQKTAIYPKEVGLQYCAIKLDGEVGETNELIGKAYRDDGGHFTPERLAAIKKEIGDCAWYLAGMCENLGFNMREIAKVYTQRLYHLTTFENFQKRNIKSVCYPKQKGVLDIGLKMAYHAGRVAWFVYYQADCKLYGDEWDKMTFELGSILTCLSAICDQLDLSLDAVAKANLRKLAIRKKKGLLGGSGSDREQK